MKKQAKKAMPKKAKGEAKMAPKMMMKGKQMMKGKKKC